MWKTGKAWEYSPWNDVKVDIRGRGPHSSNVLDLIIECSIAKLDPRRSQDGEYSPRAAERIGGAKGKYKKWGRAKWIVWGGSGGTPPGSFEILHALKCVLGAPEALFRACTQYIASFPGLPRFLFFGLRSIIHGSGRARVLYWTQTEEQKTGEAWERGYTVYQQVAVFD